MNYRTIRFIPALTGSDYCQGDIQEVCFIMMFFVSYIVTTYLGVLKPRMGGSGLLNSATILSGRCV